jgi:integrase
MIKVSAARQTKNAKESDLYQSIYQSQLPKRTSKGEVAIEVFKERLRLRWSFGGRRFCLSLGFPDSKVNRRAAESKAIQISGDMATGNFDLTLKKYQPQQLAISGGFDGLSALDLFERFARSKAEFISKPTKDKYRAVGKHCQHYFKTQLCGSIDTEGAIEFVNWLLSRTEPATAQSYLGLMKACWDYGLAENLVAENPWKAASKRLKVSPKQKAKPFTREEIGAIILAFRSDRYYRCYAGYVEFLFGTGCRTGEAIGLKWKHLSHDCSTVWIGESLSRGVRKSTKTNRARTIAMTPQLQSMLQNRKPEKVDSDALVFPGPRGGAIDDHNFRNRAWKTILTRLEIPYRKPYCTRHTLVSHALDLGINPVAVAQLTGHSVKVLFEHYAGNVNSRPQLPELLR